MPQICLTWVASSASSSMSKSKRKQAVQPPPATSPTHTQLSPSREENERPVQMSTISFKRTRSSQCGAFLLNFCGFAPPADSVEGQGPNSIHVDVLVRPDGSKWLSGHRAGGTVAYEGVPLAPSATPTNYFFGVRDPKKLEKITCSSALVMEMRSHLVASGDSNAILAGKMSYGESRSELIDTFGSRKVKIARQKVKSSRVEGEDQGALNGIIDCRNDVAPEFTSTETEGGPSPLAPFCNPSASSVAKVYPVKQLMPASAWDVLPYRCLAALVVVAEDDIEGLRFLMNRMGATAALKPSTSDEKQRQKLLCYLYILSRLYQCRDKRTGPSAKPCVFSSVADLSSRVTVPSQKSAGGYVGVPEAVAQHLMSTFTEAVTGNEGSVLFVLTNMCQAKLLVHIACLALHIDDFKCSFETLCKDLGVFAEELTDKFRLLGCSVSRNVAKMKLPITWPVSRKRARA